MIARSLLVPIGTFLKTHGIKGELNATLETEGIDLSTLRRIAAASWQPGCSGDS